MVKKMAGSSSGGSYTPTNSIQSNVQNQNMTQNMDQLRNQFQTMQQLGPMNQPQAQTRNHLFQNQFQLGMNGNPTGYYGQQIARPQMPQMNWMQTRPVNQAQQYNFPVNNNSKILPYMSNEQKQQYYDAQKNFYGVNYDDQGGM